MSQTSRIRLKPVKDRDAGFLNALMNHPSVLDALNELPTRIQDWEDAIRTWSRDGDEEDFIVTDGTAPIGWLGVNGLQDGNGTVYLKMAAFLPDFQGRGFGTAAIRELMSVLNQKGYSRIALYTDRDNGIARACYRKCGFETAESLTETMPNGRTVPRCRMEAVL